MPGGSRWESIFETITDSAMGSRRLLLGPWLRRSDLPHPYSGNRNTRSVRLRRMRSMFGRHSHRVQPPQPPLPGVVAAAALLQFRPPPPLPEPSHTPLPDMQSPEPSHSPVPDVQLPLQSPQSVGGDATSALLEAPNEGSVAPSPDLRPGMSSAASAIPAPSTSSGTATASAIAAFLPVVICPPCFWFICWFRLRTGMLPVTREGRMNFVA